MLFFKNRYMKKIDNVDKIINDLVITFTVPNSATVDHIQFLRWCAKESCLSDDLLLVRRTTAALAHVDKYWYGSMNEYLEDGVYVVINADTDITEVSVINLKS